MAHEVWSLYAFRGRPVLFRAQEHLARFARFTTVAQLAVDAADRGGFTIGDLASQMRSDARRFGLEVAIIDADDAPLVLDVFAGDA
jgi:hypothetical protein